ncbi:MAG TPA: family 78 glycoside hydrolase catalytic domain, partial [Mycobacteriales bacterium]|nr:family 78 glycoside hydrolase catalytic domain [Mycobacteriales bacterium]
MRALALRVEYRTDPVGIDVRRPRLSWELESAVRGDVQIGYRIAVSSSAAQAAAATGDLWDSGRVSSAETIGIEYDGPELRSGQRCWWSVHVWDASGGPSGWAPAAFWEMGLLEDSDWRAVWIAPAVEASQSVGPPHGVTLDPGSPLASRFDLGGWRGPRPAYLRQRFSVEAPVVAARAYVTARGLYDLHVNGQRVGEDLLRPGWTDYDKRIQYQVYDVTPFVRSGANAVALLLGSGWFAGRVAWQDRIYGDTPSVLVQLQITRADGAVEFVCSDGSWVSAASPLLWSDLLIGECFDASAQVTGWDAAELDDTSWQPVTVVAPPTAPLVAERGPAVRRLRVLTPISVRQQVPGRWTFDMGQNMVGRVRLRVSGPAGTRLVIRHAEMLEADGRLHTANLRKALATDIVVLDGDDIVYEPHFTTHGFRYVEVSGLPGSPADGFLTGIVLGSDLPQAGEFECSHPLVNALQSNIVWGQWGNFFEVPTDCPQRDERLGWTGDAQAFINTACFNADTAAFFTKWLDDLIDTQRPDGAVGDVAPLVRPAMFGAAAPGWGDAVVIVPWRLYERYGDRGLLNRCFPAMA